MALQMTNLVYTVGLKGDNSSQVTQTCDIEEWPAIVNAYLGQPDPVFPNLACKSIQIGALPGSDLSNRTVRLLMDYAPKLSIDAMTIDMPFKFRVDVCSECVTINGGYYWQKDDGTKGDPFLNRRILPVRRFAMAKYVLFGTKSVFDLGTFSDLIDHVNNAEWNGAEAETVFFESASVQMQLLLDGTIVYPMELHLIHKPSGWNKFFREDKPGSGTAETSDHFYRLIDNTGNPVYPLGDFGLLP